MKVDCGKRTRISTVPFHWIINGLLAAVHVSDTSVRSHRSCCRHFRPRQEGHLKGPGNAHTIIKDKTPWDTLENGSLQVSVNVRWQVVQWGGRTMDTWEGRGYNYVNVPTGYVSPMRTPIRTPAQSGHSPPDAWNQVFPTASHPTTSADRREGTTNEITT